MTEENKVEAVKHILATLFSAQNALRALAPEYKWAGMGNLLGDYGEFVCTEHYGLKKAASTSEGYDAIRPDGKSVQIKTNHSASQIGFRGRADMMLVIHVEDDGDWEEVYYGDFEPVLSNSRFSERDNKHMISIKKLRAMKKTNDS